VKPRRPKGIPKLHQARHGAWVLEVHYRGSALRDVFEMFVCESKARRALEFLQLVHADDQLHALDQDGDEIAVEFFRGGWFSEGAA
jgi:hypothetical protein